MANNQKNYKSFSWSNQLIGGKTVKTVTVRIFRPLQEVTADGYLQLVDTDGKITQKSSTTFKKHISDYSYVILSTGIFEKTHLHSENFFILSIKLYLTTDFDISQVQNIDFPGKSYLLEAYQQFQNIDFDLTPASKPEAELSDFLNYLKKNLGNEHQTFYMLLKESAQTGHFSLIDYLFKSYTISPKYQALFWKEMYKLKNS